MAPSSTPTLFRAPSSPLVGRHQLTLPLPFLVCIKPCAPQTSASPPSALVITSAPGPPFRCLLPRYICAASALLSSGSLCRGMRRPALTPPPRVFQFAPHPSTRFLSHMGRLPVHGSRSGTVLPSSCKHGNPKAAVGCAGMMGRSLMLMSIDLAACLLRDRQHEMRLQSVVSLCRRSLLAVISCSRGTCGRARGKLSSALTLSPSALPEGLNRRVQADK